MTLLAFHGDPAIKQKYINRVKAHMAADNLLQGIGWEDGKGCAVGCTLDAYAHSRYPIELGIPEWLAHVEDRLFEGMSVEKSRTWPLDFLSVAKPGADLERVKEPFLIMVLTSAFDTFDHTEFPQVKSAIDGAISLWRRDDIGSAAFIEAARAVKTSRALSAIYAARAAARTKAATRAARAAELAASAAWSAKTATRAAIRAADAAEQAATVEWKVDWKKCDYFADELLKLLADAPVMLHHAPHSPRRNDSQ